MPTCRCQSIVFDNLTQKKRLCKNKKKFNNLCLIHSKIEYEKPAILIQSYFKAKIIRNKLFYFKQLPCDIQRKIVWYMNENIYIKCLNNSILKVILNRLKTFIESIPTQYWARYSIYNVPTLMYAELNSKEIFRNATWWAYNINDKNNTLFQELNKLVIFINKYSLIINSYKSKYNGELFDVITDIKYIICFIIKENRKRIEYHNFKLFNKIPHEYIEFSKLFISSWQQQQNFLNGDAYELYYDIN